MTKLPRMRGRDVVRSLQKAGFEIVRVRGSHHFMQHSDGRTTVVPVHAGDQVGPGLLRAILRDCELTVEEFDSI